MVLTAFRGALGFLSRLPVGRDETAWEAFLAAPVTLPLVGYVVGAVVALPLGLRLPAPTAAVLFVVWLYLVTGINHADGLGDVGDALVVHGDAVERRAVMKDTTVGVGAALAVGLGVLGLAAAAFALASAPLTALLLVVAAEVGAKLGMATIACLGTASHDGLGSELTGNLRPRSLVGPAVVALPAAALTWPHPAAAIGLGAAVLTAGGVLAWARWRLGGVSGDVLGAGNEIARVVALHAGVVAWIRL
ncbi:MAG: adenosylcobinamide-GDP ribazoletransferase [Halobacteriota archaeon]